MSNEPIMSVRDLRVEFPTALGTVQAVRGVSFDLYPGETLGVVGESGSGKSVTFLAIMGLLPRSAKISGSATIGGVELVGADKKVMRQVRGKRMAMIFQDPLSSLNPVHRVGDQIVEMIQAHAETPRKQAWAKAIELLGDVGIPQPAQRAEQYPHEFSGGMRQRVMIAMSIANDPEVIVADEPTTALDVTVQAQILDVLEKIQRERNTSVAMITHDLGVIARVAKRIQVMYAGRVVERASIDDLFVSPTHPYTVGLMNSLPRIGQDRLSPIPGAPPNMLHPPSGCAFRPRCAHAAPECAAEVPELRAVGASESACVRVDELTLAADA